MTIFRVKGRWYVQVMGKGKIYTAGQGFPKKEDALQMRNLMKSRLRKAKTPMLPGTFYGHWVQYLAHSKEYNGKAWYGAKKYIGYRYFRKWFDRAIDDLHPSEIEKHLIERRRLSPRSANLDFEILRGFFNWCKKMGYMGESPLSPLRKFPVEKKVKAIPTKEEVNRFIESNRGDNRLLALLLVYSLARVSEVKKLRWEDINLEKRVIYLRTRKTRDGSEKIRTIPCASELSKYLDLEEDKTGFVLKSREGQPYKDLRKRLRCCLRNAGIEEKRFGFHAFRHYGASRLMAEGVDAKTIQELLGHTSLDTTNLYLQSLEESKRRAVEKII